MLSTIITPSLITGVFANDFFASQDADMISRGEFFWNHVLVMGGVFIYTFAVSYGLYWLTDKIVPMRGSKPSERLGLDSSEHDEEYESPVVMTSENDWFSEME